MVNDYCTCGAKLPPDALFCHKCGKPQVELPEPERFEPTPVPPQSVDVPPDVPAAAPPPPAGVS